MRRSRQCSSSFRLSTGYEPQAAIRIAGNSVTGALSGVREIWKKTFPERPFDYALMDEVFDDHYKAEANTGRALTVFSALAIAISLPGLVG